VRSQRQDGNRTLKGPFTYSGRLTGPFATSRGLTFPRRTICRQIPVTGLHEFDLHTSLNAALKSLDETSRNGSLRN